MGIKHSKILSITVIFILVLVSVQITTADVTESSGSDDQLSEDEIISLMRKVRMPSLSACIIKNDSVVWYEGYGLSKIMRVKKPNIDTVYPIGCITKPVTATAFMQLYEKGFFDLDDDVNDYLDFSVRNPKYPDVPVTFRMLLAHQSSLVGQGIRDRVYLGFWSLLQPKKCPDPMIKEMITPNGKLYKPWIWNDYPPGTEANYSNMGYTLLEYIFIKLTNMPLADYCQDNIFIPLNMNNTSFCLSDFNKNQLANTYQSIGPFYLRIPNIELIDAVAGVKTSINDFSKFAISHLNGGVYNGVRILNQSSVEMIHRIQYPNSSLCHGSQRYGFGWVHWMNEVNTTHYEGHGAAIFGETAMMMLNTTEKIGFLFFSNNMVPFYSPRAVNSWDSLITIFKEKAEE